VDREDLRRRPFPPSLSAVHPADRHDLARQVLDAIHGKVAPPTTDPGSVPIARALVRGGGAVPNVIVGNDNRFPTGASASYPNSTQLFISLAGGGWCSGTLIGPHTALSAAHCFWNNGWFAVNWIRPGVDHCIRREARRGRRQASAHSMAQMSSSRLIGLRRQADAP
jgi:hypothetical protein